MELLKSDGKSDGMYTVHLIQNGTECLLHLGRRERTKGFLKFWKLYRGFTNISIKELTESNQVIEVYKGHAKDFEGI